MERWMRAAGVAVVAIACGATAARAQNSDALAAFYKEHPVTLLIGFNTGGGYDVAGRLLARHFGRHLPGQPTVVVKNMPGAGSLNAANRIYNIAPKDGSEFGLFAGSIAIDPLFPNTPAKFDARRFTWLGSPNTDVSLCISWHTTPFKRLDDVMKTEMITGSAGTSTLIFPIAMNNVLGTKFKLIKGYNGTKDLNLAMERGETQGLCGTFLDSIKASNPEWLKEGKINVLVQMALKKSPQLPDAPFIMDYAKTDDDRKTLGLLFSWLALPRAFGAPPDLAADRTQALRAAFDATGRDQAYIDDAAKLGIEIDPVPGAEIDAILRDAYATPKPLIDRVAEILDRAGGN
ncbi:MAG: Bug family tripartite tricarboxylate transporter substrate binding protein [Gemmatimonas sp.]